MEMPRAPAAAARVPDACTVASAAEIAAAFGKPFQQGPGSPHTLGPVSRCDWKGDAAFLMVRTEAVDKTAFETSMRNLSGVKSVPGLGDSAYFQESARQLFTYKGTTKASLNFAGPGLDSAKIEAAERALMEKIVGRL